MEHEMRLAVLPHGVLGAVVVPYCVGCGWVGGRHAPDSRRLVVTSEWRTHIKEFNEAEAKRIGAWLKDRQGSE